MTDAKDEQDRNQPRLEPLRCGSGPKLAHCAGRCDCGSAGIIMFRANNYLRLGLMGIVLGLGAFAALGQSSDALLNKLVEKGILTQDEAKQLKTESDKNFTTALAAKNGMPDWVTSMKFTGDFRGRYESLAPDNTAAVNRERWRYRLRFGTVVTMKDQFEGGLRLISADVDSGVTTGLSGLGANQTFQNNGSKKGIFVDQAYGRWMPKFSDSWKASLTFGKMENPFVFGEVGAGMGLGMDPDYTPEGGALVLEHSFSDAHKVSWINGGFVMDEVAASSDDPFWFGTQIRIDSKWSKRLSTSAGLMWLTFENTDQLSNGAMPNVDVGNTRYIPAGTNQANAIPLYQFAPLLADVSVTYLFDKAPLYAGKFPVKVVGSFLYNPEAASTTDGEGWSLGVGFGRAGKRGTWEVSSCYKWLGADSIWEEVEDDDFGAYWASVAGRNFGVSNDAPGYYTGTNVRGFVTRFSYSPTDALTLSLKWYLTELIDVPVVAPAVDGESRVHRFQVDAMLRF